MDDRPAWSDPPPAHARSASRGPRWPGAGRDRAARRAGRDVGIPGRALRVPAGRGPDRVRRLPGPGHARHAAASVPLAGAVLVVAVLLVLSTTRSCAGCGCSPPRSPPRGRLRRLGRTRRAEWLTWVGRLPGMELPPRPVPAARRRLRGDGADHRPVGPGLPARGAAGRMLARDVERAGGIDGGQTVRLAYDIFGPVPVGPVREQHLRGPARAADRVGRGGALGGR